MSCMPAAKENTTLKKFLTTQLLDVYILMTA